MTDARLHEHCVDSQELYRGNFLRLHKDTVRLPDGSSASREYVRHPGAVVILALQGEGPNCRVLLERQYRYPLGQVIVELPAGKRDAGEPGLVCAQRELREETGFQASQWARAGTLHPLAAYSDEAIEVWLARGLRAGPRELDAGEFLEVFEATAEQLMAWCLDGSITDAKTIVGAFWLMQLQAGQWKPAWQSV